MGVSGPETPEDQSWDWLDSLGAAPCKALGWGTASPIVPGVDWGSAGMEGGTLATSLAWEQLFFYWIESLAGCGLSSHCCALEEHAFLPGQRVFSSPFRFSLTIKQPPDFLRCIRSNLSTFPWLLIPWGCLSLLKCRWWLRGVFLCPGLGPC